MSDPSTDVVDPQGSQEEQGGNVEPYSGPDNRDGGGVSSEPSEKSEPDTGNKESRNKEYEPVNKSDSASRENQSVEPHHVINPSDSFRSQDSKGNGEKIGESDAQNQDTSRDQDVDTVKDTNQKNKKLRHKTSKKNTIVPVDNEIKSHVTEKAPEPEDKSGSELLYATKQKNKKLALQLLQEGADIHFQDSVKCTVLHYAALAGFDDLVIKLLEKGSSVKEWDTNGETALHKAARGGHDMTMVILVAQGGDVHALNWEGRTPLELAVAGKHVKVLEVLCMFGADLVMQDWIWVDEALKSKDKKDQAIIHIFQLQWPRLPGFKHGGIKYSIKRIGQNEDTKMKELGINLVAKNIPAYYFYCVRLQVEFTDVKKLIKEDQELFSEIFECRVWGANTTEFTMEFYVKGLPKCNETLNIISPQGNVGKIDGTFRNEEKNRTEVKATIIVKPNTITSFMFVTIEKPEVFSITEEACTIQPQMEPDAEIAIPEDTFDEPGDLLFNVTETKDVGEEGDNDSNVEPVLLTNVLDLSMSNHQQPKQPIDMKLPMHSNVDEGADIVILSSSKEYPEEAEDWEIVDAKKGRRRHLNVAAFQIRHFSIFTGVVKKKVENDFYAVTKLIQTALNNERPVEFFVMVQPINRTEFAVVLECTLQRKAKKRKKKWDKKGYYLQDGSHTAVVQVNQWFKVQFIGNVKRIGSEQSDTHKLMFNPNRENFIPLNAEVVDKTQSPVGSIKIESIVETAQEPIRIVESNGLCSTKEIIVPRDPLIENKHITELPVYLKSQEPEPDEDETKTSGSHIKDIQCKIPALRIDTSLIHLSKRLNKDEAFYLAMQLKADNHSRLAELSVEKQRVDDFLEEIFLKWRGLRPYEGMVSTLAITLEKMDKDFEADELRIAHKEYREMRFL